MQLYLYADHESAELLANARPKALLIGSDFGNGNFGDVLQHLGAASLVRARTGFAIVSLCMLDVISQHADATSLRKSYGVDAVAFVTEMPIEADVAARLGLRSIEVLCNLSYVQLYGGGFLNEMWGEFVLGIAEHFLERVPGIPYAISGQQISPAFVPRTLEHVRKFSPRLVGARDQTSLDLVTEGGMCAEFSFDDAVESLLDLGRRLELRAGDGAFIHLNASDYTGNDEALAEMAAHLRLVAARIGNQHRPVLLQAFQDAREVVVDSMETVKRLDVGFPFTDFETVQLVTSIMDVQAEGVSPRLLTGRFGYSSSYHVTLWLQLHGIPCWLRGSNSYYEQKRSALGIEGCFEDFLEYMQCPDHGGNLQARSLWLDKLQRVMDSIKPATNRIEWALPDSTTPTRPFNFKGEPRYEQRLREAWRAYEVSRQEIERLGAVLEDAKTRLMAAEATSVAERTEIGVLLTRLDEHASERSSLLSKVEAAAEVRAQLDAQLLGAEERALELSRFVVDQQQRIADQQQRIAEQEQHAADQEQRAADQERHVAEQEHRILDQRQRIAGQEKELEEVRASLLACSEQLTAAGNEAHQYREQHAKASASLQEASVREHEQSQRLQACNEQLAVIGGEVRHFREQYEQVHASLQEASARELEMAERLHACNEQLTAAGHDARHYRNEYQRAHANLQDVSARERELAARMQEILHSRLWRWMRPFRVGGRYLRTGRFDLAGNVGLFGALQIIGRRVPISHSLRSSLGHILARFRRH